MNVTPTYMTRFKFPITRIKRNTVSNNFFPPGFRLTKRNANFEVKPDRSLWLIEGNAQKETKVTVFTS